MSNVYSTEPQTTASVVFETTHGPLSMSLWAKECPHTVRYFLQLCIDGYYDNVPFSRIIPGFMIQTGDSQSRQPSVVTAGGNSSQQMDPTYLLPPQDEYRKRHNAAEALERRRYELNSRIRFNHRGQVAMAMSITTDGEEDDRRNPTSSVKILQPQFFITLEDAGHLDGQHVVFGTIVGPSIFNAIRMGKTEVDEETNQPISMEEAPRILKTKIQSIDGLPDTLPPLTQTPEPPLLPWHISPFVGSTDNEPSDSKRQKKQKKARKGVKNVNLLSFGEEMVDDDGDGDNDGPKKSKTLKRADMKTKKKEKKSKKKKEEKAEEEEEEEPDSLQKDEVTQDDSALSKTSENGVIESSAPEKEEKPVHIYQPPQQLSTRSSETNTKSSSDILKKGDTDLSLQESKKSKSNHDSKDGEDNKSSSKDKKKKKISLVESRRAKYARQRSNIPTGTSNKKDASELKKLKEDDTMKKLMAFRQKVAAATASHHNSSSKSTQDGKKKDKKSKKNKKRKREDDDDDAGGNSDNEKDVDNDIDDRGYHGQITEDYTYTDRDRDWMTTTFKCRRHMDLDARMVGGSGADGRSSSDYKVVEEKHAATDRKQDRRKNHHQHKR